MQTINDVHAQFAECFEGDALKPFAYLVSKRLAEGHICLDLKEPGLQPDELPYLEKYGFSAGAENLATHPLVAAPDEAKQPFILFKERLYLQRYYSYESSIVESIVSLVAAGKALRDQRTEELLLHRAFIESLGAGMDAGGELPAERVDWQQAAAILGALNNFTIITGGPGTGKTTTVARILAILYTIYPPLKCALAAPTGKAAVRMAESLKASAMRFDPVMQEKFRSLVPATIHRLLKYIPDSPYFRHNKANPLVHDLVIVDEASMIDAALFAKLLDAIGPNSRIILLGDKDQLASVEAGSLLGDLCQAQAKMNFMGAGTVRLINSFISGTQRQIPADHTATAANVLFEHVIELKRSHRFSGAGGIGKFSKAVINSDLDTLASFADENREAELLVDTSYSEELFNGFISDYTSYIREKNTLRALENLNRLRVLCAVREGPQGLVLINRKVESWLVKNGLIQNDSEFYENRPIIVTRNYPELQLFNGDVGIIRRDEAGVPKAWFEDSDKGLRSVLPGYLGAIETVYAMTIHKSQGSEYDKVLVLLPAIADQPLFTRELLYTAVTRSKRFVLLQCSRQAMLYTAGRKVKRASGIMDRF